MTLNAPIRPLSPNEHQRLEQAAQAVSRSAQLSGRSIGINWRRLASSTISEHYHVEYPGLSNEQIAIRETLDEVVRKVVNHELELSRFDGTALQGTLEDILSDILDFMVHDAVASSSDNSDGGSGPDSSDEEHDDDDDDTSDPDSEEISNNVRGRHNAHSDNDDRPSDPDSGSASDSSDTESESESVAQRYQHHHHHHPHQHHLPASHSQYSTLSSRNTSRDDRRLRGGGFITIKRRQARIPSPVPAACITDGPPRCLVRPLATPNIIGPPGTASNLPPPSPPSSLGHGSDDGLLQQRRTEEDLGLNDQCETFISISSAAPAFATLGSSVTSADGLRRRGAAASLVAALGSATPPEEGKANDGGSICCSTM